MDQFMVERYIEKGLWSPAMARKAVQKGIIASDRAEAKIAEKAEKDALKRAKMDAKAAKKANKGGRKAD
jgi:hypothetical protein